MGLVYAPLPLDNVKTSPITVHLLNGPTKQHKTRFSTWCKFEFRSFFGLSHIILHFRNRGFELIPNLVSDFYSDYPFNSYGPKRLRIINTYRIKHFIMGGKNKKLWWWWKNWFLMQKCKRSKLRFTLKDITRRSRVGRDNGPGLRPLPLANVQTSSITVHFLNGPWKQHKTQFSTWYKSEFRSFFGLSYNFLHFLNRGSELIPNLVSDFDSDHPLKSYDPKCPRRINTHKIKHFLMWKRKTFWSKTKLFCTTKRFDVNL